MTSLLTSEAARMAFRAMLPAPPTRAMPSAKPRMLLERARSPRRGPPPPALAIKYRLSVRELAAFMECNHGSVVRRLRRIRCRLCEPFVVRLVDPACPLATLDRELRPDRYSAGRARARVAQAHGISPREVRRRVLWVKGWAMGRREGVRVARAVLRK